MFEESKNPRTLGTLVLRYLAALKARPAAELVTTPTVHLYTAGPSPIPFDPTAADFTEATFSGYAAVALTLSTPNILLPSQDGMGKFGNVSFVADAAITPPGETIIGYFVDDGAGMMYLAEEFDSPVQIANFGDFLDLQVVFPTAFITAVQ